MSSFKMVCTTDSTPPTSHQPPFNEAYRIRCARPEDAPALYDLKLAAFGKTFLPYTIYQAPQALVYLRQLIEQSMDFGNHRFIVAENDDGIIGHYHALIRDLEFFLNYIAVAAKVQGKGYGRILLQQYEANGRSHNCQRLVLDVFESNNLARDWYWRHGFHCSSSSFQASLRMRSIRDEFVPLDCAEEAWKRAHEEEDRIGFSKIQCTCGSGFVMVGLIARTRCKLLRWDGVSLEQAVQAICHRFWDKREFLILSSLPEIPPHWEVHSSEKVLRLIKDIS